MRHKEPRNWREVHSDFVEDDGLSYVDTRHLMRISTTKEKEPSELKKLAIALIPIGAVLAICIVVNIIFYTRSVP